MALRSGTRFQSARSNKIARSARRAPSRSKAWNLEALEERQLLARFEVTNLNPTGTGSLRWAIVQANQTPGPDTISFGVSGTIVAGRPSLPAITDTVKIDGTTAPTFAGAPVVTVDFHGTKGLQFAKGADGSILSSLSLVKAGSAGVTLNASHITLDGNYIGVRSDGKTPAGNRGDGVRINSSSHDNLIGHVNPVTSVSFYNTNSVSTQPVTAWQGIRDSGTSGRYLITGTSNTSGLLYVGPISGVGGTSYAVNYPNATTTSIYGPDQLDGNGVRLVGTYKNGDGAVHGFLFEGTTADLANSSNYRTVDYPGAQYTFIHSTMGGLLVGNADGPEGNAPIGKDHAFLYDIAKGTFLPDIVYPGATTTTAYGIWYNGGTSYTIAGGYSNVNSPSQSDFNGYLVDYDTLTGKFTHWTSYAYPNGLVGQTYATHFQGISGPEKGVYTLAADSVQTGTGHPGQGSLVAVRRNDDGTFGDARWVDLNLPNTPGLVSANSVAGNQVVGIVIGTQGVSAYQATVNTAFQLSNVISGNSGNGIGIYGSNDNRIAMNNIGTDASGTVGLGNGKNGILVTSRAARNFIGGQAITGNNPTSGTFVRPPQGNLISGNRANGVLIEKGSTFNVLSGNFVGTAASGNSALGNRLDGVAIVKADNNALIGCNVQDDPFVYYNVLSGNGGNGLRVTSSNNITVHANFMGVGANNATVVANGGDGMLVSGSSKNTQVGGVIPLGNVISGNNRNGIEVSDTASGFVSFNTFAGIYAFAGPAPNQRDGILVTSRGGNNLIRTCVVSGNLGNGIEIGGNATGVQVTETTVGTNTKIQGPIPNGGSGILFSGRAHGNAVGGFQPSIEPQVTVSSNARYGIEFAGSTRDNVVFHTYVGTDFTGRQPLGNTLGGIYLGAGTSSTTIGGTPSAFLNKIDDNLGDGVIIQSSRNNTVQGNEILANQGYGLLAAGKCNGTVVRRNTIASNTKGDVNLTNATGVVYVP